MKTQLINDLIYIFEIAELDSLIDLYYRGKLTQRDIIKIGLYLIDNLPTNHGINGNVWATMAGIIDFYREHDSMSDKQAVYMIANISENIQERLPDLY